jgi:hypothetical protein
MLTDFHHQQGAARDEPDGANGATLNVHGHNRLGARVPHDDFRLALRAEQLDVIASPQATPVEVPNQFPQDSVEGGTVAEVQADDNDGIYDDTHAHDAKRARHLISSKGGRKKGISSSMAITR